MSNRIIAAELNQKARIVEASAITVMRAHFQWASDQGRAGEAQLPSIKTLNPVLQSRGLGV